ncbi:MAG: phage tail protein [Sphingomonas sp.]|uniref:phage tail protein n=1 Tax=Sphingomonas sp. TaxID=28214 RepID=UPI003F811E42
MGGKTTSTSSPKLNAIQVQSSTLGLPISLGWGRGRMKCNLMWYGAFKAIPHTTKTGGKGLGGGSKNTTYTYTASIMMGIGEGGAGGVRGIRTIYKDTAVLTTLSAAGLSLAAGAPTQSTWSYLTSLYPTQPSPAIPYSGIAYVYVQDYDLSDSATLSNHSFEIDFATQLAGAAGGDADPKDVITDFLTNASYGVPGWTGGLIGDLSDYSLYCRANNLLLSPVLESQSSAASVLQEWLTATNSAAYWSEGVLKIRPYGDAPATGNGVSWAPNMVPAYDLDEDDLIAGDDGAPVSIEILDQSDAYNIVQFEFLDRANQYNVGIATAQDLDNIVTYGPRKQDPTTVHCICDAAIARQAVQLYGQRVLYTREKYTFKLAWNFALLEPTDLVTLSTASDSLQLDRVLVRITEIAEDGEDLLTITAEGIPTGVASAPLYPSHAASGYRPDTDVAPGDVSPPWMFIAPANLAGLDPEIWLAVASTSPSWGGCQVWISTDGVDYSMVGTVDGPARCGVLTAALPAGADPDTTNILSVDLSASLGQLTGVSASDMDAGATLCMVGDEIVAYRDATLDPAAHHYELSPLRRGLRGTTAGAHAASTPFARLDEAIFKIGYDASNVGGTVFVKLPSFNIYGRGLQDLSGLTAYSIAITSAPGRAAYRDIKFRRSYSQPTTPSGDNPAGWSDGIPAGTETIWSSTALKTAGGTLVGVWSTPQARSGLTPRGDYSSGATYYLNNSVGYGGGSYVATQDNFTGHPPSGTAQANAWWDVLAAPGNPGTPATAPGAFSASIALTGGSAINLRSLADAAGYTGASDATVTFTVPTGVTIRGLSSGIGIDTGTWPTSSYAISLTLVVQSGAAVEGGGGDGGRGGGGNGGDGGDAIYVRTPMSGGITINSGGSVIGGGGGGGGGLSTGTGGKIGGGGGGGGAPNGNGGEPDAGWITDGNPGNSGTDAGGGTGGTPGGGAGGGYATAGTNSSNGGGAGGGAGFAVRKNGNAVVVTNNGTMTGTAG